MLLYVLFELSESIDGGRAATAASHRIVNQSAAKTRYENVGGGGGLCHRQNSVVSLNYRFACMRKKKYYIVHNNAHTSTAKNAIPTAAIIK